MPDLHIVTPGLLDYLSRKDLGVPYPEWSYRTEDWDELVVQAARARYATGPQPGRDCPACPAPRLAHDGWGCADTGCQLSVALITRRPGA